MHDHQPSNDDGDAVLDPIGTNGTMPEAWVFTCSYTIAAHQRGEANPVVNTATVTAVDELGRKVNDTDRHATTLLHPSIALVKTGPATALAGSLVTYALAVSDTGDTAFAQPLVVLTDARCEAPPVRESVGYTLRRKVTTAGVHRVSARVTFLPGSAQRSKTLQMTFGKCRKAKRPSFTG